LTSAPDPTPTPTPTARRLPWLLPAVAYAALIFWLSHQSSPVPWLPSAWWTWDKLLHAVEYAGLAALLVLGLTHVGTMGLRRAARLAILLAAAYGASDELHQAFVPGRDASWLDWAADSAGALVGGILAVPFLRRWGARASIRA
jgi:VanZ family protein